MGKQAKRVYLEAIRERYRKAYRVDKTHILDEFCAVCGYSPFPQMAGGKRWLAPVIEDQIGNLTGRYIEPFLGHRPGMSQTDEPVLIQAFVAQTPVE